MGISARGEQKNTDDMTKFQRELLVPPSAVKKYPLSGNKPYHDLWILILRLLSFKILTNAT